MLWVPGDSFEVAKLAFPPLSVPDPITEEPSRNCTVPVAPDGLTVAVNVTVCRRPAGFGLELSVVVVFVFGADCTT